MGKMKDLLMDIESRITNGDAFEDIVSFVQSTIGCDEQEASDLVFEVEGDLCMEEERSYYEDQIVLIEGFSEEE
jgi:hypothetical protein